MNKKDLIIIPYCMILLVVFSGNLIQIFDYDYYNIITYLLSYELGFISRGFMGTIVSVLPDKYFILFLNIIIDLIVFFIYFYIYKKIYKLFKEKKDFNFMFNLNFIICSFSFIFLIAKSYQTKFDLYWILIFIITLILFEKGIDNLKLFVIFAISIIGILIHQGFIFVTMPFICVFFYENNKKKCILPYMFTTGCTFLLCQFGGKGNFEEIVSYVTQRMASIGIESKYAHKILNMEYNMSVFEHMELLGKEYIGYHIPLFLYIFSFSIVAVIYAFYLFKKLYHEKFWLYLIFLFMCQVPLLILTIDIERWALLFVFQLNLLSIYKLSKNKDSDIKLLFNIENKKHILLYLIHLLFNFLLLLKC